MNSLEQKEPTRLLDDVETASTPSPRQVNGRRRKEELTGGKSYFIRGWLVINTLVCLLMCLRRREGRRVQRGGGGGRMGLGGSE